MTASANDRSNTDTTSKPHVDCDCEFAYPSGFKLNAKFKATEKVTAIVGPSGSGKTTLLFLIAGLLRPTSGSIQLAGQPVTHSSDRIFVPPHRRQIGFLFQRLHLFPHQRVETNLKYVGDGALPPLDREPGSRSNLRGVVKTLEIDDLLNRAINSLSGGQQQRVALGRALLSHPRILLLDEPFTAMERSLRDRIAELVERVVNEFDIPVVLVSHNEQMVTRLTEQTIVLRDGKVM